MATPAAIRVANLRASKVAELAEQAKRANPADGMADAWQSIESSQQPTPVTFRQAVSRWYENTPGGFDAAVENSQRALKEHGDVFPHNSPIYGDWSPADVDRPADVQIDHSMNRTFSPRGVYGSRGVLVNPAVADAPLGRNAVLEHELTHHLTLRNMVDKSLPVSLRSSVSDVATRRFDGSPSGSMARQQNPALVARSEDVQQPDAARIAAANTLAQLAQHENYVMGRAELDPRVAEVRRRYAFHVGKDVTTPAQAADAWEWYKSHRDDFENLRSPRERPTMEAYQFSLYDSLPPESKQIMFKRMTQIPSVLAPVGVLSGLTEER